jgi:hypothetical protein
MVELLQLDRLILVAYFEPKVDLPGNLEKCQVHFSQHLPAERRCVKVWD